MTNSIMTSTDVRLLMRWQRLRSVMIVPFFIVMVVGGSALVHYAPGYHSDEYYFLVAFVVGFVVLAVAYLILVDAVISHIENRMGVAKVDAFAIALKNRGVGGLL